MMNPLNALFVDKLPAAYAQLMRVLLFLFIFEKSGLTVILLFRTRYEILAYSYYLGAQVPANAQTHMLLTRERYFSHFGVNQLAVARSYSPIVTFLFESARSVYLPSFGFLTLHVVA